MQKWNSCIFLVYCRISMSLYETENINLIWSSHVYGNMNTQLQLNWKSTPSLRVITQLKPNSRFLSFKHICIIIVVTSISRLITSYLTYYLLVNSWNLYYNMYVCYAVDIYINRRQLYKFKEVPAHRTSFHLND